MHGRANVWWHSTRRGVTSARRFLGHGMISVYGNTGLRIGGIGENDISNLEGVRVRIYGTGSLLSMCLKLRALLETANEVHASTGRDTGVSGEVSSLVGEDYGYVGHHVTTEDMGEFSAIKEPSLKEHY